MSVNRRVTNRGAVYDVRLRTVDGSSYKRSFRTRREAEVFEARERADRSRGTWLDPRRAEATFDDVARVAREQPGEAAGNARPRRRHHPLAPRAGARPAAARHDHTGRCADARQPMEQATEASHRPAPVRRGARCLAPAGALYTRPSLRTLEWAGSENSAIKCS